MVPWEQLHRVMGDQMSRIAQDTGNIQEKGMIKLAQGLTSDRAAEMKKHQELCFTEISDLWNGLRAQYTRIARCEQMPQGGASKENSQLI